MDVLVSPGLPSAVSLRRVIRHALIPVLVLHQSRTGESSSTLLPVTLVTLDGSPYTEAALNPTADVLAALPAPEEGIMHLVRVIAPPVEIRASAKQPPSPLERGDRIVRE